MKTILFILAALAAGFAAGILLSEVIGIVGMLVFQQPVGIKYLPVYLAILSAGAVLVISVARHTKAG
jgi:hypothetical protein